MDKVLFSSKSEVWETPQNLFDRLDQEFHFDTDVCALPENAKCDHYFSPADNGLAQEWTGCCYMNPPYGRNIWAWIKKAYESVLPPPPIIQKERLLFAFSHLVQIQNGGMTTL